MVIDNCSDIYLWIFTTGKNNCKRRITTLRTEIDGFEMSAMIDLNTEYFTAENQGPFDVKHHSQYKGTTIYRQF